MYNPTGLFQRRSCDKPHAFVLKITLYRLRVFTVIDLRFMGVEASTSVNPSRIHAWADCFCSRNVTWRVFASCSPSRLGDPTSTDVPRERFSRSFKADDDLRSIDWKPPWTSTTHDVVSTVVPGLPDLCCAFPARVERRFIRCRVVIR